MTASDSPDRVAAGSAAPRDWGAIVYPGLEWILPPRELWVHPQAPLLEYLRWTYEFPSYLKLLCGLRQDDAVLEIGCNHGRTMLGLLGYLRSPGRYEGFDIMREHVDYARQAIRFDDCPIGFTHADIYNGKYNPGGTETAASYVFPYGDAEFDVVFAASVFTHMLPLDVDNYVQQSARVMKPGARALFSVFVLDYFRGAGTAVSEVYDYTHPLEGHDGVAVTRPDDAELYIAYSMERLQDMARRAELNIVRTVPGTWSKSHALGVCEQDLIVLEKPGRAGPREPGPR